MTKVVVLSCCQHSLLFERKFLALEEGGSVILGRADPQSPALKTNGLFQYPPVAYAAVSRKHAEISCKDGEVYLTCFNHNTFLRGERVSAVDVPTKIENDSSLILGGYFTDYLTAPGAQVICTVSIFDGSSEKFEYFSLVDRDFPFYCQWPGFPPFFTIRLEVLYAVTLERLEVLNVLAALEESELSSPIPDVPDSDGEKLKSYLQKLSKKYEDYKDLYEVRQNDQISQCILTVACCRNFRTRNWFVTQERKLFTLKWLKMAPHEQIAFLEMVNAVYDEVPDEELKFLTGLHPEFFPSSLKYFKIPFTEASILVNRRRAVLIDGYCYISLQEMYVPLIRRLRISLWESTKVARSNLDKIWYDDRIRSIIQFVERHICDPDRYKLGNHCGDKVTQHNVHKLCDESFPLCMKILHYHLVRDHHLRNGGRFQYTLFLKGIGLNMSGSLCFWKEHFTKKMDENAFMKRYAYHIRHAYGVEGKKADYPPQNCADIIKATPGPLEYHGCPFKVLDEIRMKEALRRSGLEKEAYPEILELVKKGAPLDACKKYFELTQGDSYPHPAVNHPNIYYDASRRLIKLRKERVRIAFESSNNVETKSERPPSSAPPAILEW